MQVTQAADENAGLRYESDGEVGVLHFDDGKANAISSAVIEAFGAALDRAEKQAKAVAILGRPGRFCAGFDLTVMRAGGAAAAALVTAGGELALRLYGFPLPVVVGCTGHALAMGAILLMATDVRIGALGDFKIGLNEVAIGLPLPGFAVELARERLGAPERQRAVVAAEIFDPARAVPAGFLDRTLPSAQLEAAVRSQAQRLAAISGPAHSDTKRRLRADALERMRQSLDRPPTIAI